MGMDDIYITVHERLIGEYMDENPNATEEEVEAATLPMLEEAVQDYLGDMTDIAYERWKDSLS
jgi:hypothetical protein